MTLNSHGKALKYCYHKVTVTQEYYFLPVTVINLKLYPE